MERGGGGRAARARSHRFFLLACLLTLSPSLSTQPRQAGRRRGRRAADRLRHGDGGGAAADPGASGQAGPPGAGRAGKTRAKGRARPPLRRLNGPALGALALSSHALPSPLPQPQPPMPVLHGQRGLPPGGATSLMGAFFLCWRESECAAATVWERMCVSGKRLRRGRPRPARPRLGRQVQGSAWGTARRANWPVRGRGPGPCLGGGGRVAHPQEAPRMET